MTYEVNYEFPLGSGKIVKRNVNAVSEEQALIAAGVSNPTLTAKMLSFFEVPKTSREARRNSKLEFDNSIAKIVLEVMEDWTAARGSAKGIEIGGAEFTNVATLVAIKRGIMTPNGFSSVAHAVALRHGVTLAEYSIPSSVSTMPGRLVETGVIKEAADGTGYVKTGVEFTGFLVGA